MLILLVLLGSTPALARSAGGDAAAEAGAILNSVGLTDRLDEETGANGYQAYMMQRLDLRALSIGAISLVCLTVLVLLLRQLKASGSSPETLISGCGLVLVIYAALVLPLIANTHEQLNATIGIIGALAGYLFGRNAMGGRESHPTAGDPKQAPASSSSSSSSPSPVPVTTDRDEPPQRRSA